ncbi:alpha/beta fold hydrolase [Collimonas pratensis]|uniref:Alpha/beta hydrolase fold family protein n=1 Tax=Collimonas pratensis TaxID=279113 RepID=A0A127QC82_9BURK|nr:alpha/beta hydrolase [Collimonas pratensis]AMP07596.1 alpha/beta hydrolase fold family protein [Collimonas pratensis]
MALSVENNDRLQLLLLPGFMLDQTLWDDLREGLQQLGQLHFGDLGQDDSISTMAARVLQQAPPRFILIGFSMGGYVAQAIMQQAPERVIALALLNTSARQQNPREIAGNKVQLELAKQVPFKGLTSRALASSLHPDLAHDRVLLERLQAMALRNGKDVFIRQLSALRSDGYAELHKIQCPTLIVASNNDQLSSIAESQQMLEQIATAHMVLIENCGHMTPLEKPQQLLQILSDWISSIEYRMMM